MSNETTASASIEIAAPVELVWERVGTIDSLPTYSPECIQTKWIDDVNEPAVGAKFAGTNNNGAREWETELTVTSYQPQTRFAFATALQDDGSYVAEWSYDLVANGDTTTLTETVHAPVLAGPDGVGRMRQLAGMINATLTYLKADTEAAATQ